MPVCNLIDRQHFPNMSALADALAQFATSRLRNTLSEKGKASLVVPGGQTPRAYLPRLGQQDLPWQHIFVTLSDERWVSATHPDSNEQLVREHFLRYMRTQPHFTHLKTTHTHPDQATETVHTRLSKLPLPFSLTILGLGEDGHIASLFPGMALNPNATSLCQVATPPTAPSLRISLSFRALITSDQIILVITGKEKRRLLDRIIQTPDSNMPFVKLLQYKSVKTFETDTNQEN